MKNSIKKLSLIGDGDKGLKAVIVEYRNDGNLAIPTDNTKKQKTAVPSEMKQQFKKLRYYLLETTERIQESWHRFFSNGVFDEDAQLKGDQMKKEWAECRDLISRTFISEVEYDANDGLTYKIFGTVVSKDGYVSKTESPYISDEGSTIMYREVADIVGGLFEQAVDYFYGKPKAIDIVRHQLSEQEDGFSELSIEEQMAKAAALLEKRGCIIIASDEDTAKAISGGNSVTDQEDAAFGVVDEEQVSLTDPIYKHTVRDDYFDEAETVSSVTSSPVADEPEEAEETEFNGDGDFNISEEELTSEASEGYRKHEESEAQEIPQEIDVNEPWPNENSEAVSKEE